MQQATLGDIWASTAAGAFVVSENNLHTTDAFYEVVERGIVAVSGGPGGGAHDARRKGGSRP